MSGFGAVAEGAHLPALRSEGIDVLAVSEPSMLRREAASRRLPSARIYESLEALLANEKTLDALIVCSPPNTHADSILAGIRAGIHVMCEKPLTLDTEAFAVIQTESVSRNVCVYSINNWAFSPQWSRLLEVSASGRLGAVRHAEIRVLRTKPSASALAGDWRKDPTISGGGILVDHGWHNLYLLRRLLGDQLTLAQTILHPVGAIDEVATVLFEAPGASGVIHLSWRAGERSNFAFISGEKGTAELRDDCLTVKSGGVEEITRFPDKLSGGSAHPDWLASMWPAFKDECSGRGRGLNLAEAAFCLATIRTAYDRAAPLGARNA